jgi:PAS domain S-box-containing protein
VSKPDLPRKLSEILIDGMGVPNLKRFANINPTNILYQQSLVGNSMVASAESNLDWYFYILETAAEGIWIVDCDSMITMVNQKMSDMLGYPISEMIGQPLFNFIELEEVDKVRYSAELLVEPMTEISQNANRYFRFLRRNGEALIASISVTPLFDQNECYRGTLGRVYDITQRIQSEKELSRSQIDLQQSEERYRLLASYATDIISLHRAADGRVIFISNAAQGLLGYGEGELERRSPLEFIHPDDQIRVELAYRVVLEQPISNCVSYRLRKRDQSYIWIESTLRLVVTDAEANMNSAQIVAVSRDVTARREVEAELQSSAERLRLAIESTQEGLWDWNLTGEFSYFSLRFFEMLGLASSEDLMCVWFLLDHIHPHDRTSTMIKLYEHIDGLTTSFEAEFRIRHEDGNWIWLLSRAKVVGRDSNQNALRLVGTFSDISDRKIDQANLQRQYQKELLLKRITTEIRQTIDADRIFVTTASELGVALGVSRCLIHSYETQPKEHLHCVGEYLDKQVMSLLSLGIGVEEHLFCQVLLDSDQVIALTNVFQEPIMTSLYNLCHDIQLKSLLAIRTSYLGQPNGAILLHQCNHYRTWTEVEIEILEVVAAQVGIAIAQADLLAQEKKQTIELANQNAALAIANQKAYSASLAKSEFLAMMSHEIRTPMNAIIGLTEMLLLHNADANQRELLNVVFDSSQVLLSILNDILDFSKVESGKLDLESAPLNLRELIESTFDLVATKAAEKNLALVYGMSTEVPRFIECDSVRLKQILINLLSNGVKFSASGEVVLTIQSKHGQGSEIDRIEEEQIYEIEFAVHDTGIGIDPNRMERLFQPFSQIDSSTTRQYGGTGLGLAISKRICEMMGGRMWVVSRDVLAGNPPTDWFDTFIAQRSEPGRMYNVARSQTGSSFYFTIPAKKVVPKPNNLEIADSLKGKVLLGVVHDTVRHLMSRQLREWGLQTRLAETSEELLALLQNGEYFDLAILDLPTALEDVEIIRKLPTYSRLPLIIAQESGQVLKEELEFTNCFRKPIKQSLLYEYLIDLFRVNEKSIPASFVSKSTKLLASTNNKFIDDSNSLTNSNSLRILLTEDNLVNQKVAKRMLQHIGFTADVANNGLEAIAAIEAKEYDVILMDIQMPEMDGIEASKEIRKRESEQSIAQPIKIIAMTANAMAGDREMCLAAGMDEYVSKPVSIQRLAEILAQCRSRG